MAIAAGIPTPKLYVIRDPAPNAFATGRDPSHAVVCATEGLLSMMDRGELEGVVGADVDEAVDDAPVPQAAVTAAPAMATPPAMSNVRRLGDGIVAD